MSATPAANAPKSDEGEEKPGTEPAGLTKEEIAWWLKRLAGYVGAIWLVIGLLPYLIFCKQDDAGTFGDSFGMVNSLFSALAFAGVIFAIRLQAQELRNQQKEIRDSKIELRRNADAQAQLVRLNALSTLLQSYVEQFKSSAEAHTRTYNQLRLTDPKALTDTLLHKINVCNALVEETYRRESGTSIGTPAVTDVFLLAKMAWADQFVVIADTFQIKWLPLDGHIGNLNTDMILKTLSSIDLELASLDYWADSNGLIESELKERLWGIKSGLKTMCLNISHKPMTAEQYELGKNLAKLLVKESIQYQLKVMSNKG